jgi:hypothetical protein
MTLPAPTCTCFLAGTLFASTRHTIAYSPGNKGWVINEGDWPGQLLSFLVDSDGQHWRGIKVGIGTMKQPWCVLCGCLHACVAALCLIPIDNDGQHHCEFATRLHVDVHTPVRVRAYKFITICAALLLLPCPAGYPSYQLAWPAVWRGVQGGIHAAGSGDCGGAGATQSREDAVPGGQQAVALALLAVPVAADMF